MKSFFFAFLSFVNIAHATFMIDTNSGFATSTDSKTQADISDMTNHIFIGANWFQAESFYWSEYNYLFSPAEVHQYG
jgi:hypothetical protein